MKATSTAPIMLSGVPSTLLVVGLLLIAALAIATPVILALIYRKSDLTGEDNKGNSVKLSFFQLPYMTWFIIHYVIPVVGIVAVVSLALVGALDMATTATLLGGLFGYVLGSAANGHASASAQLTKNNGAAGAAGAAQTNRTSPSPEVEGTPGAAASSDTAP